MGADQNVWVPVAPVGLWNRLHMCGAGETSASCQHIGDRLKSPRGGVEFRTVELVGDCSIE